MGEGLCRYPDSRLPNVALDRLIQGHSDLALVGRLRSERARRIEGRAP